MRTSKRPAAAAFLSALAMLAAGTLRASHAHADDTVVPEPGAAGEIAGGTEHGVCSAVPFSQARIVAESLADYLRRHPDLTGSGEPGFLTTGDPARVSDRATQFLRRRIEFAKA